MYILIRIVLFLPLMILCNLESASSLTLGRQITVLPKKYVKIIKRICKY